MFVRSDLELASDRSRWWLAAAAVTFVGAWVAWSSLATVTIYRTSARARLEGDAHTVQSGVAGRVAHVAVVVGQPVEAGDLLVELDDSALRLERRGIEAERDAALFDIERIEAQLDAHARVQRDAERLSRTRETQGAGQVRSAARAARHSADHARRLRRAAERDAVPRQLVVDAEHRAQLDRASSRDRARQLAVLEREAELDASRRGAQDRALRRDLQQARNRVARLDVEHARVDAMVERMRVVSPIRGEIASVVARQPGAYVELGAEVAVVVPPSELRAVAWLPLDGTVGWVRPGQPARIRLRDFPWTRWGSVPAAVARVSREPEDGLVRVELRVDASRTEIPLDHGLPAEVEIAVDRATPAEMLIRAAGRRAGARREPPRTPD